MIKSHNFYLLSGQAHHLRLSSELTVFFFFFFYETNCTVSERATNPQLNEREIINVAIPSFFITPEDFRFELLIKTPLTGCLRASEANPWQRRRGCLGEAPFEVVNS